MLKPVETHAMEWGKQMPVPSDVKTLEFFKFPWSHGMFVDETTAVTSLWLDSDVHCFICNWFCVGSQPNFAELESVSSISGMTFPKQFEASNIIQSCVPEWIDTCAKICQLLWIFPSCQVRVPSFQQRFKAPCDGPVPELMSWCWAHLDLNTCQRECQNIPSGKRLHNYGKSPFSMGKSTINGHFQ